MKNLYFLIIICITALGCKGQEKKAMEEKNNPLLCDIETGVCETPDSTTQAENVNLESGEKPIRVIYFTDPICSSCWGIEPQLRKLKLAYGKSIHVEYRMGGLLPDWSYNSGGISKPSDVAHHWDEVSLHYDMPIDGDVWLEDPLDSSYPPSIAVKAAQMQDEDKAVVFMRKLREMVFLEKKNITKWEYMEAAGAYSGLDVVQLKKDYEGEARQLFQEDLALAKQMGVRGFPSIFVIDQNGNQEFIYGSKPYPVYEGALLKLDDTAEKNAYKTDWKSLFEVYPTLTAKEYAVLADKNREAAELELQELVDRRELTIVKTKNGNLYLK
jgi:predicted DsbA family dithiol-disulfide isomerase